MPNNTMGQTSWKNDDELFALIREELYTAVVGDIMDKIGLQRQFLPPQIRPLKEEMVIVGRAMTVLEADCFEALSPDSKNPVMIKSFGLMLEALDDIRIRRLHAASPQLCQQQRCYVGLSDASVGSSHKQAGLHFCFLSFFTPATASTAIIGVAGTR